MPVGRERDSQTKSSKIVQGGQQKICSPYWSPLLLPTPLWAFLRLTKSDFQLTNDAQASFETVKRMLLDSKALTLFDPTLPTVVSTDASDYGLGGVLSQVGPDNIERTVAFASRTLTAAEPKYATVEEEALACVWAVER